MFEPGKMYSLAEPGKNTRMGHYKLIPQLGGILFLSKLFVLICTESTTLLKIKRFAQNERTFMSSLNLFGG